MEQGKSWKAEVEEIVAKQALALNYEYGMQCRVMPLQSERDGHTMHVRLDMTHSGHDFDMDWLIRFADDRSAGTALELVAPDEAGGKVWTESYLSVEDFQKAVTGMPYLIKGFFAGRDSVEGAAETADADPAEVSSGA